MNNLKKDRYFIMYIYVCIIIALYRVLQLHGQSINFNQCLRNIIATEDFSE